MCMSNRQPATNITTAPTQARVRPRKREPARRALLRAVKTPGASSVLKFEYSMRMQAFQKCSCLREIEFLVPRLDAQEKTVRGCPRESLDVERRVIWRRQPIERQHSKHGRERRAQNRQLESNRNPHRPAIERLPADIQRETDHVGVIAHSEAGQSAAQAAEENQRGKNRPVKSQGLAHA